jgi:hypothetical protein
LLQVIQGLPSLQVGSLGCVNRVIVKDADSVLATDRRYDIIPRNFSESRQVRLAVRLARMIKVRLD